ncbi:MULTISPECIES: hypothetical protein [unclassified Lentimonas]|uniref:hypothetical protein n=1 Tax=unclassified Lentimonas TaxID=2630993 RepID=UPI00138A42C1|nr:MULTISPECIES: hypothetical protein [unclassified Lentimonas]
MADQSNLSSDAQIKYLGDTVTLTGAYTGDGKVARIEWELATDPIVNTVVETHAPKQNWEVIDQSPVDLIYSAPNDPTHYEIYFYEDLEDADDTHVSYTFGSAFTADHKLSVGSSGFVGMEYIMERLYGDNAVTSFLNDDGSLLFEAATVDLVLGAKVGNALENTIISLPSYQVTVVPEPSQFAVILALLIGTFVLTIRRR